MPLAAGARNNAGLYFKIEPGWHIYWKNAGDSGEPPHIRWTLPEGIAADPLQFPAPKRLPLGPLMDFGYENEVLFPLNLNVVKTAKAGPEVLHAKVDWLVCREVCIPGKAELEVSRNVAAGKAAGGPEPDAGLWRRLGEALPKPLPSSVKAVFQPTPAGFRLSVDTGESEPQGVFFPADQDIIDNPAPQRLTSTPKGLVLDLKKDANLAGNPAHLSGVLELAHGRAFELTALPGKVAGGAAVDTTPAPAGGSTPPSTGGSVRCCGGYAASGNTAAFRSGFDAGCDLRAGRGVRFESRLVADRGACLSRRADSEPDAVRLSGALSEGTGTGAVRQRGAGTSCGGTDWFIPPAF